MPRRSTRPSGSGGSLAPRRCCTLLLYGKEKGHVPDGKVACDLGRGGEI